MANRFKNLSSEYFTYLTENYKVENKAEADYYFGRKPIIYKTCPRYVAEKLRDAWNLYSEEKYNESIEAFESILKLTDDYSAVIGYANSLFDSGREKKSIKFLIEKENDFKETAYYYNIKFKLADYCAETSDSSYADSLYREIIKANPNRTLFYLSNLRVALLKSDSLTTAYLKGSDIDKYLLVTEMNRNNYNYFSFPVMIDLAGSLKENYKLFLGLFSKPFVVNDFMSSFALYKLSVYLTGHSDFIRARKMAALSLRFDKDKNLNYLLQENYNKITWLSNNSKNFLASIKSK